MESPINIIGIVLALVGGASSYLHKWLNGEPFILTKFLATMIIGGFVGTLVYYLSITQFAPDSPIVVFLVGASGAIGYDMIKPLLEKVIGKKLDL